MLMSKNTMKTKLKEESELADAEMRLIEIGWSGKATLIQQHMIRNLKEVRMWSMQLSAGRAFQEEEPARANVLG